MSRFLITGGKGFVGKHFSQRAIELWGAGNVTSVGREHDLRDPVQAGKLFQKHGSFDYILHFADVAGNAQWSAQHAAEQFCANAHISVNVLDAWRRLQPQARLICFSSIWAYPEATTLATESEYWDGRLHQPTEHYGVHKKFLGVGLEACKRQYGLKGTSLVLGSVYGPEDLTSHVIPSLLTRMRQNPNRLEIWGDGSETRDFIYVDDQIEGILRHLDYNGQLLNIGSGRSYSIREVVETLTRLTGYRGDIIYDKAMATGAASRRVNVELATKLTGWPNNFSLHTLEEGLRKTIPSVNTTDG
jgi:GDP-L-fucose synthase